MEERLSRFAGVVRGRSPSRCSSRGPWVGWWTLIPLGSRSSASGSSTAISSSAAPREPDRRGLGHRPAGDRRLHRADRRPRSPRWPGWSSRSCTLPARFNSHAVARRRPLHVGPAAGVTLGVDPALRRRPPRPSSSRGLLARSRCCPSALMKLRPRAPQLGGHRPADGMLNRNALQTRIAEFAQQAAVVRRARRAHRRRPGPLQGRQRRPRPRRRRRRPADVAYRMRKALRAYDLAYRLGGEEFLVVLPGADADARGRVAEGLRAAIADARPPGCSSRCPSASARSAPGRFDYDVVFAEADLRSTRPRRTAATASASAARLRPTTSGRPASRLGARALSGSSSCARGPTRSARRPRAARAARGRRPRGASPATSGPRARPRPARRGDDRCRSARAAISS